MKQLSVEWLKNKVLNLSYMTIDRFVFQIPFFVINSFTNSGHVEWDIESPLF